MHPDPHPQLATVAPFVRSHSTLRRDRCAHRLPRIRERDKERVTLGVDLNATMGQPRFAQQPMMTAENLLITIAKLVRQARGPSMSENSNVTTPTGRSAGALAPISTS